MDMNEQPIELISKPSIQDCSPTLFDQNEDAKEVECHTKSSKHESLCPHLHLNLINSTQQIALADTGTQRVESVESPDAVRQTEAQPVIQQRDSNQNQRARRRDFEQEFNQNNLQYLLQNLDNLREILQTVIMNTELSQALNLNLQSRNSFNIGVAQALNNVQLSILNSQNQIYDQLHDIRRIIYDNQNNEQQISLFNFLNLNNTNQNANDTREYLLHHIVNAILSWLTKTYNIIFMMTFGIALSFILHGLSTVSDWQNKPIADSFEWLTNQGQSRMLLMGFTLLYAMIIVKFNQLIYGTLVSNMGEQSNFFKDFYRALIQQSPIYNLSFFILVNPEIIDSEFGLFFMLWILIWNISFTKMTGFFNQKLNKALILLTPNQTYELSKIKRIKYIVILYLLVHFQLAYAVLWLNFQTLNKSIFLFLGITLLTTVEPIKVFASASISLKNYTLISNNNTRELSDPKFKSELLLDFLYQIVFLLIIGFMGAFYTKHLIGFIALYWISFQNSIQNIKCYFKKYNDWRLLQKKINEIFPIIEQEYNEDNVCSICHDVLLIARKLPCGHLFHLKCLMYWLENQKTCPNCRADAVALAESMNNNNRNEDVITRWRSRLQDIFQRFFT